MSEIKLRPYQLEFINNVRAEFVRLRKNHCKPAVVGVAPCGAGKTIMTGWMIKEAALKNKRSIFFVHRHELIQQTAKTFCQLGIDFGIIEAGHKMNLNLPVQIASVQTLANRLNKIPQPNFLICDECHHILAATYKKILDAFPDAYLLGVTATPLRTGGITLNDCFNSMVESLSVNQLIARGNLTRFKYFAPEADIDLSSVKSSFGEYNNEQLAKVMSQAEIIGDIVLDYRKLAEGKSAICYCVNVEHSKTVADAFNQAGIPAAHCDANTPPDLRKKIVNHFRRGDIKILCNAELFGEGFDVPNVHAVILARPTQSLTLFIQQAMRPLRPDPNDPDKVAIIIDHVKNYQRHGFPNDPRNWSLDPIDDKKPCPHCGKLIRVKRKVETSIVNGVSKKTARRVCPECGYEFPKGAESKYTGRSFTHVDGTLNAMTVDFTPEENFRPQIKNAPTTVEELLAVAKLRGYKLGWVAYRALEHATSYQYCLHIADVVGYKRGWAYHKWLEIKNSSINLQSA